MASPKENAPLQKRAAMISTAFNTSVCFWNFVIDVYAAEGAWLCPKGFSAMTWKPIS